MRINASLRVSPCFVLSSKHKSTLSNTFKLVKELSVSIVLFFPSWSLLAGALWELAGSQSKRIPYPDRPLEGELGEIRHVTCTRASPLPSDCLLPNPFPHFLAVSIDGREDQTSSTVFWWIVPANLSSLLYYGCSDLNRDCTGSLITCSVDSSTFYRRDDIGAPSNRYRYDINWVARKGKIYRRSPALG